MSDYDTDILVWSEHQAALLRRRAAGELLNEDDLDRHDGRDGSLGLYFRTEGGRGLTSGITAYLKNGGTLEKAAVMANRASTRTTQLYDRRSDEIDLDDVERIYL